jgi:predicted transcriptional regulator
MSLSLLKVTEDESILETTQRMRARGVRRAPVVAKDCSLVGIIAIDDILQLLSEELLTVSRLMAREAEQEKQKRSL